MAALPWICRKSLRRVLPEAVQAEIGVPDGSWAAELDRLLRTAQETLAQDVAGYADRRERAVGKRQYGLAETYERVIRNFTQRDLLGVLANRNVLPKYGFPVDTVELRITQEAGPSAGHLELTRDLSAAVHEYAPGAEIVAGGYVWTSAGVYRLPDRDLVSRWYAVCQNCGHFREDTDQLDALCPACQGPQSGAPRRYVEPVYGFVAQRAAPRRPGQSPPRRSWNGAVHMTTTAADVEESHTAFPSGHTLRWTAGARGEMVAVSVGATSATSGTTTSSSGARRSNC